MRTLATFIAFVFLSLEGNAQTATAPPKPVATSPQPAAKAPTLQDLLDILKKQQDLLDIVKNQQSLIEDIIYNQRLQKRQNEELEQRLEETLLENSQLRNKIANLEAAASNPPSNPVVSTTGAPGGNEPAPPTPSPPVPPTPPPQPATFLPPAPEDTGEKPSWHRLFTLSGTDGKDSDPFEIQGKTWRVVWHNLDKPGRAYQNTSALFISAYPKDDTVPQKICAKLGTGGDTTDMTGAGTYTLKVEASGGSWELAVEDMR